MRLGVFGSWRGGIAVLTLAVACAGPAADAPLRPTAPEPAQPVPVRVVDAERSYGAMVGVPFEYRAGSGSARFSDPGGSGLRLSLSLPAESNGLTVEGERVVGRPTAPGIVTATLRATDGNGNSASTDVPIIIFAADLTEPRVPVVSFVYADAASPLPLHLLQSPTVMATENTPVANPVTDAGAALGRVLFYDKRLSRNDRVSCSSCHQQQFSFSDTARLSVGFAGEVTRRHSMALTNVRFYRPGRFFRDERAGSLEQLVLQPISDPIEMGLPARMLVPKLSLAGFYAPLFAAAFGSPTITEERIALALAQFVRSLKSVDAGIDGNLSGTRPFTAAEHDGEVTFIASCRGCHESYVAVGDSVRNNGLDSAVTDAGAGGGRFKPSSLRNVAVRGPYMHDGRLRTLEDVVDFYDSDVKANPQLDRKLRNPDGSPLRLHLTPAQRSSLLAFLRALTDDRFLRDPRFADPFAR